MSIRLMTAAWDLSISSTDKLVLLALADWSNDDGVCWPSMAKLAAKTGLTDRAIRACVGRLCEGKHLTRLENPGKGVNYTVHPGTSFRPEANSPRNETTKTPERRSTNTPVTTNTSSVASQPTRARAGKPDAFPRPDWADAQVWADLLVNRKRKNLAPTATAHAKLLRDLEALVDPDWPPGRILEAVVSKGWGAIYPSIKDNADGNLPRISERQPGRQPDLRGSRPDPSLDLLRAARAAEAAESAASSGSDNWGAWPAVSSLRAGGLGGSR